jgi:hypothetical protein
MARTVLKNVHNFFIPKSWALDIKAKLGRDHINPAIDEEFVRRTGRNVSEYMADWKLSNPHGSKASEFKRLLVEWFDPPAPKKEEQVGHDYESVTSSYDRDTKRRMELAAEGLGVTLHEFQRRIVAEFLAGIGGECAQRIGAHQRELAKRKKGA